MRGLRASSFGRWAAVLIAASGAAAQGPADADVWLAPLSRVGDSLVVGPPRNVTHRPGYDNQPSFTPDSKAILYTAVVDGQADVFRYDLASGATTRLTTTPESEYSPTVTPDGRHFSVVRVERDSAQRLWKFPLAGGDPALVLPNVRPVGYHAWLDDTTIALYLLGQPARLLIANVVSGESTERAKGIGRAMQRIPGSAGLSFVFPGCEVPVYPGGRIARLTCLRVTNVDSAAGLPRHEFGPFMDSAQTEFHAWIDRRTLIGARDGRLLRHVEVAVPAGACGPSSQCRRFAWSPFADLEPHGVRNISRLAASPDGKWLAFVAEAVAPTVSKQR